MHDYDKIASIVGDDKIEALREAGVEISDKPAKPTTGLLGRWAKAEDGTPVLISSDYVRTNGNVLITYQTNRVDDGTDTIPCPLSSLKFPEETTRPEDVEPGEAWLVKVDQGEYIVGPICAFKHSESHWTTRKSRFCHEYVWPNADVTLVAPLVPARPEPQSEHPRTLTSVEDYESAPVGTIVASPDNHPWVKTFDDGWVTYWSEASRANSAMAELEDHDVLRWGWGE